MAEGGAEFGHEDPDLENRLDHDDGDDEQEVNRTQPFQPSASSTPYHRGEHVEMQTMQHEQSGLPSSEEIPLLGDLLDKKEKESIIERVRDFIRKKFPRVDFKKLGPIFFGKKAGNENTVVALGERGREIPILKKNESGLLKDFMDSKSLSLGPRAEDIIDEDRDTIREQRQRLKEAENQLKLAEDLAAEREKASQEVQDLRQKTERMQAQIDALQDEQGSNLESEAELRRLRQQKKNYQTDFEKAKKEASDLAKRAKNIEEAQAEVDRERARLAAKESERNAVEERLNSTKPLDDLKEQESELQRQNAEDQTIIQDENNSPWDVRAAEGRVAERNEEIARLQTQIAERERARPLLDRVKEIFKKYGVTVTAVLLAAGVTIGAVVGSITKALKATGQALGKGLKDIGAKLGSMLPGLIGSIVSFLFKAASQAIGFLAEHTWLLILALVAFLFEKYLKKRR